MITSWYNQQKFWVQLLGLVLFRFFIKNYKEKILFIKHLSYRRFKFWLNLRKKIFRPKTNC